VVAESDYTYRPFRAIWLRMGLTDASSFDLALAYAVIFMANLSGRDIQNFDDDPETMKYYTRCLARLYPRLNNDQDRVSQGVVSTVLGFICHDVTWLPCLFCADNIKLTLILG
jgi:hypothetical protein